jgi:hypothetical protein
MTEEQQLLLQGNCVLNDGGLEVGLVSLEALHEDLFKNAVQGLDVLYELLLQRQHPNDAWIWGQLLPLSIIVHVMERTLKDGAGAISSTTGMFIYQADNKLFRPNSDEDSESTQYLATYKTTLTTSKPQVNSFSPKSQPTLNMKQNKTHHPTTRSRTVSMTFRNYKTNPAIHLRPRF